MNHREAIIVKEKNIFVLTMDVIEECLVECLSDGGKEKGKEKIKHVSSK
jgi:hypothetical protein